MSTACVHLRLLVIFLGTVSEEPPDHNPPPAVDFLRDTIRARPAEIMLLAIGPLTNLGVLFALDPEMPSLLKQLVL